ncbi:small ribosomal subunit protein uS17m [Prorops nasuta]|uniref:small ribosomal subunit protein uS17m n=1 Tax=Prorops nasuta TaxID=863751 RepID=UPI0034CDEFE6
MASKRVTTTAVRLFLGKCMPTSKENAAKIRIPRYVLNERLMHHFLENNVVYAHDPNKLCKTGDTVLIRTLPEQLTRVITHEVVEVVYKCGDVIDPISGKHVVAGKYRDEIKEANELYGQLESSFDYNKAPPRGSQEGKRDFTNKKTYVKYQDDKNIPQPYAW